MHENSTTAGRFLHAMQEYDAALKSVLMRREGSLLKQLTGLQVTRWHNVEFPEVRTRSVDLLGETDDGRLVHVELQSSNDPHMAFRMLKYSVAICGRLGRFPEQIVLYVGRAPLKMELRSSAPGIEFECPIVDFRELDGEALLASPSLSDNVLAVLAKLTDKAESVRRIVQNIATVDRESRLAALAALKILAGLRDLGPIIEKELDRMPIQEDIMDHPIIGPQIRRGIEQGIEQGQELGERKIIRKLLAARFGQLPVWAAERLNLSTEPELESLAVRLLRATTLEELFG